MAKKLPAKLEGYKEELEAALQKFFGIGLNDCGFTDEQLKEAIEEGTEAEELAKEQGIKHDLDRIDLL